MGMAGAWRGQRSVWYPVAMKLVVSYYMGAEELNLGPPEQQTVLLTTLSGN